MNIRMTGIDHEHAAIGLREQLSFVSGQVSVLLDTLRKQPGVCGCTLISTCNRTELYLSCIPDAAPDPAALLCAAAGVPHETFSGVFLTRTGRDAVQHLFEVACGLRSQILGEDQIVSQVKQAAALAREAQASDPLLETLFRCAVTAGKEVKTETRLTAVPLSAAHRGVTLAEKQLGGLAGRRAVVIGNGEMGRLAAGLLVQRGALVTVTLRSYRHGQTVVPRGCRTQPYEERLNVLDGCDLVISATTSPHYTLTADQLAAFAARPALVIDLALPRDIEPAVSNYTHVLNMDDLGALEPEHIMDRAHADEIIAKQMGRFYEWVGYRASLPAIEAIKQVIFARTWTGDGDEDAVRAAVDKTVDLLLGSIKEAVTPQLLEKALDKMQSRLPKSTMASARAAR